MPTPRPTPTPTPQTELADQAVIERISTSFDKQGLMAHLGARLGHVGPGEVHIHLPKSPQITQQHGYFHGGATSTVADSAGGYAALTLLGDEFEVLTVEFKINLVAPADGEELHAVGTVLKPGRTLTVCRIDVFSLTDGASKLVAAGQQTIFGVRP